LDSRLVDITVLAIGDISLENIRYSKAEINVWSASGRTFLFDPATGGFDFRPTIFSDVPAPAEAAGGVSAPPQEPAAEYKNWLALNEFDWVKSDLFQGSIKLGNDILHVYAQLPEDMLEARRAAAAAARPIAGRPVAPAAKAPPAPKWPAGPIGGLPLRPDIKVVAVDANTRRPRYLQLGEELREYVFSVPTAETLELPRPIQERLKTLRP
jgi:hypothetical protein